MTTTLARPTRTSTTAVTAEPTPWVSPSELAGRRRGRAEQLAARVGGDRARLEAIRARLLDRLHRASDDVRATDELRIVDLALAITPRPLGAWAWQERVRETGGS
jgi:hypothetical protein